MKTLEEYKKEVEQDPKARRRLKKLEKEFEAVEESLTDEELIKYGLKPAVGDAAPEEADGQKPAAGDAASEESDGQKPAYGDAAPEEADGQKPAYGDAASEISSGASSVIDLIARKM